MNGAKELGRVSVYSIVEHCVFGDCLVGNFEQLFWSDSVNIVIVIAGVLHVYALF